MAVHGISGGTPHYLTFFDDNMSIEQNIAKNFLSPEGYLFEETLNLMKQECREPAMYNAIIRAIASGSSRLSEIASKVGIETGSCSNYINTLISLGIVKKETPFGAKANRRTSYSIADGMFRFWYRFVLPNMAAVQQGAKEQVLSRIMPQLPAFLGSTFEEACKEWLWRENLLRQLPFSFTDLGRWWGNDPLKKSEAEIDIIAEGDDKEALFAECKWTNDDVDLSVLESLSGRSEIFRYPRKHLYIFAKRGFTSGCQERAAEMGNVSLISYADLLE